MPEPDTLLQLIDVNRHISRTLDGRLPEGQEPATLATILPRLQEIERRVRTGSRKIGHLRASLRVVQDHLGLPDDLEIVHVFQDSRDQRDGTVSVLIEGKGMPEVKHGDQIREVDAIASRTEEAPGFRIDRIGDRALHEQEEG